LENLTDGFVLLDTNGFVEYVNVAGCSLLEMSINELIGKTFSELVVEIPVQPDFVNRVSIRSPKSAYRVCHATATGSEKVITISVSDHFDTSGKKAGTSLILSETTSSYQYEQEIKGRLALEMLISEVSGMFVNGDNTTLDESINQVLAKIGEFAAVDRSYIFLLSEDGQFCNNSHEWCRQGVEPQLPNLQQIPIVEVSWWMSRLWQNETIYIPDVSKMSSDARNEKAILEMQDIQSVLAVPLISSNSLIGFVGFDSVRSKKEWGDKDRSLLAILGQLMGSSLERSRKERILVNDSIRLQKSVESNSKKISNLIELNKSILTHSDIFIITMNTEGSITSVNPYVCKVLGYTTNELLGQPLISILPDFALDTLSSVLPNSMELDNSSMLDTTSPHHVSKSLELTFYSKSCVPYNVLLTISTLSDERSKIIGFTLVAVDVTNWKQSQSNGVTIRELGFKLATCTSTEDACSHIKNSILTIDGILQTGIYLLNNDSDTFELRTSFGFPDGVISRFKTFNKNTFNSEIILKGLPLYGCYSEIFVMGQLMNSPESNQYLGIIPINHEGHVIGCIVVTTYNGGVLSEPAKLGLEIIASEIGGTLARLEIESNLLISQHNFQELFNNIEEYVSILDKQGFIVNVNPSFRYKLGYNLKELIGKSIIDFHPADQRQDAMSALSNMLCGAQRICTIPLCTVNGEHIDVETKVTTGKWDGVDVLFAVSRDFTERNKTQESLRASERRWMFALEGSGDGVWDLDLLTNEVFYSSRWKWMLGYEDDEISNSSNEWFDRVHPDDIDVCTQNFNLHLLGEIDFYSVEHRLRTKSGAYKWVLSRAKVVERDADGLPTRIIGTFTDFDQRKMMEKRLMDSIDKERELNELKSRFVSMASHEFRTPLASLLMINETLLRYLDKLDKNQIEVRLFKLKDQIMHLTNIVNDVLQLSKMQEGKMSIQLQRLDIVDICRELVENFNTTVMVVSKIRFRTNLKCMEVLVDKRLITQVVNNLISNSIKYTTENAKIRLDLMATDNEWKISVKDNGIGIPESEQKHLFEPFFRAENVAAIQGNGLGMSIIQESVQLHGGHITFWSKLNYGSRFDIHLPLSSVLKCEVK
jgi:PAS domain S-box-containing protein